MKKSTTPAFRIEWTVAGSYYTPTAWPTKHVGQPSNKTLAKHIAHFEGSCHPGGCNAHLGIQMVLEAQVIRQSNGEVVATYKRV